MPLLSGAFNFRDLGGLPTVNGSRTVFGSVFRSDALDNLTPHDLEILGNVLGIRTVVDLRAAVETEGRQPPWRRALDAELVSLSLSDEWTSWGELDAESRKTLLARKYLSYLDSASENIISALNVIADNAGRRPTIVHCTAGKDRTGVLVAILLSLLGVERDAMVADYLLTSANMDPIMERLRANHIFRDRVFANPAEVYLAQEHTMRMFLQTVDERDGGLVAWALSNRFAPEQLRLLRIGLIEPTKPAEESILFSFARRSLRDCYRAEHHYRRSGTVDNVSLPVPRGDLDSGHAHANQAPQTRVPDDHLPPGTPSPTMITLKSMGIGVGRDGDNRG